MSSYIILDHCEVIFIHLSDIHVAMTFNAMLQCKNRSSIIAVSLT